MGIWAAVWATVLAYFTMAALIVIVARKIYPTPVNYGKIFISLALVGSGLFMYYILTPTFWVSVLAVIVLSDMLAKILPAPGELGQIKKLFNR